MSYFDRCSYNSFRCYSERSYGYINVPPNVCISDLTVCVYLCRYRVIWAVLLCHQRRGEGPDTQGCIQVSHSIQNIIYRHTVLYKQRATQQAI